MIGAEHFNKGTIPGTPENRRVLNDVVYLIDVLRNSLSRGDTETLPVVEQIKDRVRQLGFGDWLTLRPEATASVVRAYIEHGMQVQPGNVKLYYMGPMFRRERPQKGRYRQFYQIGAEALGSFDAPGIDAEVIEMLMRLFERLKLKGASPKHQFDRR